VAWPQGRQALTRRDASRFASRMQQAVSVARRVAHAGPRRVPCADRWALRGGPPPLVHLVQYSCQPARPH
jgi:hypothetical protein